MQGALVPEVAVPRLDNLYVPSLIEIFLSALEETHTEGGERRGEGRHRQRQAERNRTLKKKSDPEVVKQKGHLPCTSSTGFNDQSMVPRALLGVPLRQSQEKALSTAGKNKDPSCNQLRNTPPQNPTHTRWRCQAGQHCLCGT